MPRPAKHRFVEFIPEVSSFEPQGMSFREEVIIPIEELEAIRLKDLEGLDQEDCAQRMHISRATFQRVLESARMKMADAMVNGKAIRVEGGNFEMAMRRFRCAEKGHEWEVPFEVGDIPLECPTCYSSNIYRIDRGRPYLGRGRSRRLKRRFADGE